MSRVRELVVPDIPWTQVGNQNYPGAFSFRVLSLCRDNLCREQAQAGGHHVSPLVLLLLGATPSQDFCGNRRRVRRPTHS